MKTRSLSAWAVVILLLSHSGCGVDPETMESLRSAVNTVSSGSKSANGGGSSRKTVSDLAEVHFEPLYPDRTDPFTFPGGTENSTRDSTPAMTISEVEVLGFAQVGEQHVLLRSGDQSRSLRVGESMDGIRVIAINPPTVRLKMGTLVWTATMFDKGREAR